MSGLLALYTDESTPPSKQMFEEMSAQMAYRAVDGHGRLDQETIRLGHQHCYTTPQERGEHQPLYHDGVAITVDGRVDNRTELTALLSQTRNEMTDAELILHLYHEYGVDCLAKIIGPFALCIWDEQANRVIVARDKTGIRHVFYAKTDQGVAICSDMRPLTVHPDVRTAVNTDAALSYLHRRQIPGQTVYTDIQAVRPGEYVSISGDDISTHRYWNLERKEGDLQPTESLDEILYNVLADAIECRLRGMNKRGILLSGGVDSTAVAGIASTIDDGDLCGYSVVFEDYTDGIGFHSPSVAAEESHRIDKAVEQFGLESVTITGNGIYPFYRESLHEFTFADNPCHTTTQNVNNILFRRAAANQCRILLTGHDAEYLRGSYLRIVDLMKNGQVRKLMKEIVSDDTALTTNLLNLGLYPLVADWIDPAFNPAVPETSTSTLSIVEDGYDIPDRARQSPSHRFEFDSVTNTRFAEVFSTDINRYAKYAARRVALRHGVELRYPFSDARIFEFIVATPAGELLKDGEPYWLYEQMLETVLPQSIISQLSSKSSVSFGPMRHEGLLQNEDEIRTVVNELQLGEYLPLDQRAVAERLTAIYSQLKDGDSVGYTTDDTGMWPLIQLEYWIRSSSISS